VVDDQQERAFDMRKARQMLIASGGVDKASRKAKRAKLVGSVDKRSLRKTHRTEQFNFRAIEGLKARAQEAAELAGIALAEWMERAVEAYLAQPAKDGGDV
jgi:hypothetical protein